MLNTRITGLFGIDYPIMSAPMALHSGGTLAAAISRAGGLGSFGAINPFQSASWVTEQIEKIRDETARPFAVGYITNFIPIFEEQFTAAIDSKPPVVALSFGKPQPWLDKAKSAGAKVICQVQTLDQANEAANAGADVLVAQGTEAGGHTGTMSLVSFLARIIDRHSDIPIMAAGGISDGRTLAAVLAAGADGAWMGTAFLATPECIEVHERHKQLIVESDGQDTIFTRVFDIASGLPWPDGVGHRVRRNKFVNEWDGRDEEIVANREKLGSLYQEAKKTFDADIVDVAYGQGAGALTAIRPAAEVLHTICNDAERILRKRSQSLLTQ